MPNQRSLLPLLRSGRSDQLVAGVSAFRDCVLADPVGGLAGISTLTPREKQWLELRDALFADDLKVGLGKSAEGLVDDLLAWPNPLEVDLSRVRCPVRAVHGSVDDGERLWTSPAFEDT